MSRYIQVCTTTDSEADARQIAATLVEQRLAACAQIDGPIQSVYRWQAKVERAEEWRLTLKTSSDLLSQVEAAITKLHHYECPEVVATPLVAGSEAYLKWLGEQLIE